MSDWEAPTLGYFHVPQDSLRKGSAREADPRWPSFDVVHRRDYEQRVLERDDALRRLGELEQALGRIADRDAKWDDLEPYDGLHGSSVRDFARAVLSGVYDLQAGGS